MTTRIWTYAVFLSVSPALALAPTSRVLAAVAPSVAEREAKAGVLFEEGKHDEAIAVFEGLYAERSSPNYLYNIARIQEDAGNLPGALKNYEKFVQSPGVELELREAASVRVRTIRKIVENTRTEPEVEPDLEPLPQTETETDPEPSSAPEPRAALRSDSSGENPSDEKPREGPKALGVTGYVFLGAGVVSLAAGGLFGALATQDQDRLTQEGPVSNSKGLQEAGKRKAIAADVLFAVGGTLAVAGLTMVIVDAVRGKKRRANASLPNRRLTFGASGNGVMLGLGGRL